MKNLSMIDTAVAILSKEGKAMEFAPLWAAVQKALEMSEEEAKARIGNFYTDLSVDAKFHLVIVDDGKRLWDLRDRYSLSEYLKDKISDFVETDKGSDDIDDIKEEADYDASIQGTSISSDSNGEEKEESNDAEEEKRGDDGAELLGIKVDKTDF